MFGKVKSPANTCFKWDYLNKDTPKYLSNQKSERKRSIVAVLNSFVREAIPRADDREV